MESRAASFSKEADFGILGIGVYVRGHHVSAAVDEDFQRADVEQHFQFDGFRMADVQLADIHVILTAGERNAGLAAVDGKYAFFFVKIYYCFMCLSREEFDTGAGSSAGLQSQADPCDCAADAFDRYFTSGDGEGLACNLVLTSSLGKE